MRNCFLSLLVLLAIVSQAHAQNEIVKVGRVLFYSASDSLQQARLFALALQCNDLMRHTHTRKELFLVSRIDHGPSRYTLFIQRPRIEQGEDTQHPSDWYSTRPGIRITAVDDRLHPDLVLALLRYAAAHYRSVKASPPGPAEIARILGEDLSGHPMAAISPGRAPW